MWRSMIRVAAATAAFGAVHSVLASRAAKQVAADLFGQRNRNGLYRTFYLGQSVGSFAILAAYIYRQPSRELYHIRGPLAVAMHAGQLLAVGYATSAAYQVGILRITGLRCLAEWTGDGAVAAEPEAQGPALDADDRSRCAGPFAWSRHPLNFAPVMIFWLWPRMTTNLLAFNTAATAYLVLGSWHEEARLQAEYGNRYAAYRASGAAFYLPTPNRGATQPMVAYLESHACALDRLPRHVPSSR